MRHRPGFTLIELIIVVALVAIVTAMAAPTVNRAREQASMTSARQQLTATLVAARASAIQKGRPARMRVDGNVVTVWVETMADSVQVVARTDFAEEYGVDLVAATADTLLSFDPRGFLSPRLAAAARYRIERGADTDSVCVTTLGQLLPRECTP